MNRRKTVHSIHFWTAIFYLKCVYAVIVSTNLPRSAFTNVTNSRSGNERNVMLVLPVLQGSNDPSDPRLEFWYTKPPVTVVIDDTDKAESKSQSKTSTTTTQRYTETNMVTTADIITTDLPFLDYDTPKPKSSTISMTKSPPQKILQPIKNNSHDSSSSNQDIYVSFAKNKMKYSPSLTSTSQPNLQVISAEPKWKSDIHKLIEYDKLKAQKSKPTSEKTTILPTSTRIHYYSDFIPLESHYGPPSSKLSQSAMFEESTSNPQTELHSRTTESDSQYDFVKVYDMMKRISLKPLPFPKPGSVEHISSSDREYFDVLREMAVPTISLFKERTAMHTSTLKTPSSRVTDQWVFTYGPEELTTLPTALTEVNFVQNNPLPTIQQSPTTFLSSTSQTSASITDDKLTDDFKRMLIALGILKNNETITTTTESNELWMDPESFTIDPLSYSKFKRIPTVEELPPIRKDMQSLLNSFGLLPKTDESENYTLTRVARHSKDKDFKNVSLDEGVMKKSDVNISKSFSEIKIHPTKSKGIVNIKNKIKVSKSPLSLSKRLIKLFNRSKEHPLLALTSSFLPLTKRKAHSSRQSSRKVKPNSTMTKSTQANNNASVSYDDLASSFGGGETAKDDPDDEILTTTPNGLYFLVDWNSFLKTGEDKDEKPIRLNFSPHVGDPKLFVPITFP